MANWAAHIESITGLPVAKRAKHGIHFQRSDGQIEASFSGKPCHWQDTDGLWKPIDTKLLLRPDGYYGCPHSKVKINPDGTVAVAGTDYIQRVELPSAQTGLLDGDKLIRKFAFGEQRMWVTEDGFKSEIQLNRIPTLTEARKLIASESGTLSKEYLKSLTTATDANGDSHTYSTLSAFRTWLASAAFPVMIDPDFAGDASDATIDSYFKNTFALARSTSATLATTATTLTIRMRYGAGLYGLYRAYLRFDTSSIGAGGTITQVNLKIRVTTAVAKTAYIIKQDWSSQYPLNATNMEAAFDGTLTSDKDAASFDLTSAAAITSGNLANDWISKTGATYYSLIMDDDYDNVSNEDNNYAGAIGAYEHATESYRPVLSVTYTAGGSIIPIVNYYNRLRRN